MKVWLLFKDCESGLNNGNLYRNEVIQDLNLDIIFKSMSNNDKYIYRVARSVMLDSLTDKNTVLYRQDIIADANKNYEIFNEIYQIATHTIAETENYIDFTNKTISTKVPDARNILNSINLLAILVNGLEQLKDYLNTVQGKFTSEGMRAFYQRLSEEYNYEFAEKIKSSLNEMNFLTVGGQITFSATVGQALRMSDIIVNDLSKEIFKRKNKIFRWIKTFINLFYKIFKRNVIILGDSEVALNARDLESAGLLHILQMYKDFIREHKTFFESLKFQMAFYVGCSNLQEKFINLHIPICNPVIDKEGNNFEFSGLYDMSMALYNRACPVTNDMNASDKLLLIISGANQGGKSTYLRSIGIAQLLMQSGLFVPANYYCNVLCDGIFTHFTRREDRNMNSGKLDEELGRMNRIISNIKPSSMLLLNESFASTTEREGSKIAFDVVNALYEAGVRILTVTHLFEFTKMMYEKNLEKVMFLSAERLIDGTRTYHILESEPERTSYGLDLYEEIVGL